MTKVCAYLRNVGTVVTLQFHVEWVGCALMEEAVHTPLVRAVCVLLDGLALNVKWVYSVRTGFVVMEARVYPLMVPVSVLLDGLVVIVKWVCL